MFRIKICGITRLEDAQAATAAGADAVGLNFYESGKRFVDVRVAAQIAAALPKEVAKVGVFVNAAAEQIATLADELPLDWVQLHGDEPPEFLAQFQRQAVIRAFRLGTAGKQPIIDYLSACRAAGRLPDAVLIDAFSPQQYGGTGKVANWSMLVDYRSWLGELPLILAGGLTPENVGAAISQVRPAAVDTASGVEHSPGVKDAQRVAQFVRAAAELLA